jgi:hypothetical protein
VNQNQITVTRGDNRLLTFELPADYTAATARLRVERLFSRDGVVTVVVDEDEVATTTVTVALANDDTERLRRWRRPYRYSLRLETAEGDVRTVRRGLFVVVPEVRDVEA